MIISNLNYKMAEISKNFLIYPDWLMGLLNEFKLKPLDKLIYLCLYQHADVKTGLCYPSYKVLGEYTGIKKSASIKASLDRLYDSGLVELVKKGGYSDGVNTANLYKIKFPYPNGFNIVKRNKGV